MILDHWNWPRLRVRRHSHPDGVTIVEYDFGPEFGIAAHRVADVDGLRATGKLGRAHGIGAKLDGHVLSFDIINVGTDDRPADRQVDAVTQYEKLLRLVVFNRGYSFATLQVLSFAPSKELRKGRFIRSTHSTPSSGSKSFPK